MEEARIRRRMTGEPIQWIEVPDDRLRLDERLRDALRHANLISGREALQRRLVAPRRSSFELPCACAVRMIALASTPGGSLATGVWKKVVLEKPQIIRAFGNSALTSAAVRRASSQHRPGD